MGQIGQMGGMGQMGGGTMSNVLNPYANQHFANNLLQGVIRALGQMGMADIGVLSQQPTDPFNNMHTQFKHCPTTFTPATTSAVPDESRLSIEAMDNNEDNMNV